MPRLRFVMVGGFLGAGKTTTLARLALYYRQRGQRVGLVTNDQAQDLVDTNSLRRQGFAVEEVAGACFCCKFDDLIGKVELLQAADRPEVILAEPVGSCTDLVATVAQPLKDLYGSQFEVAPYIVLFKPSHGLKILRNEPGSGFSPKAAYIFKKQLEEADAVLINRIDELPPDILKELQALLAEAHPGTRVLPVSARTGQGFDAVTALLDEQGDFGRKILDIDYDTYAEGEAEMGWVNCQVEVVGGEPWALDDFLIEVVDSARQSMAARGAEVAHLKVIGQGDVSFAVANLVATAAAPELSIASGSRVTRAEVTVNARVAADPDTIEQEVVSSIEAAARRRGASATLAREAALRPGRPTPTHRYAAPVA